jgi:hypothetical protein
MKQGNYENAPGNIRRILLPQPIPETSIASQSTLEGSSSTDGGCASWAHGTTLGHSTLGGQDTNVCALSCPSNWATESNANIRKTAHKKAVIMQSFNQKDKLADHNRLTSGGGRVSLNAGSMTINFLKLGSFRLNRSQTLLFTSFGSRSSFLILVGSMQPWYSNAGCTLA